MGIINGEADDQQDDGTDLDAVRAQIEVNRLQTIAQLQNDPSINTSRGIVNGPFASTPKLSPEQASADLITPVANTGQTSDDTNQAKPAADNSVVDPSDIARENAKFARQDITTWPVNNLGLTDDQVLAGKPKPSDWFQSTIDPKAKTISVDIGVKYDTGDLSGFEATKLKSLAQDGVSQFWGRTINLNGDTYAVNVNLSEDNDGMPIALRTNGKDKYEASQNMNGGGLVGSALSWLAPLVSRHASDIFYQQGGPYRGNTDLADKDFQVTAAHEIGHPMLAEAGGREFSWSHEGTSQEDGGKNGKGLDVPDTGDLDLMKYYNKLTTEPQYARSIASQDDVKNLIYSSKRN